MRVCGPRLRALPSCPDGPLFSLLTPLRNTPPRLLDELILSVRCQSWSRWELILVDDASLRQDHLALARRWAERDPRIRFSACAVNGGSRPALNQAVDLATGDFLALLDPDALLHPMALSSFVRLWWGSPDVNLLYANEARINETSRCVSSCIHKPPYDLTTLLRVNYLGRFTAIRRDLVLSAVRDGLIFRPQFDGVEDHDLFLRVAMTGRVRPLHVPMCLYYARTIPTSLARSLDSTPDTELRRHIMLEQHLADRYPGARWRLRGPSPELGNQYPSLRLTVLCAPPSAEAASDGTIPRSARGHAPGSRSAGGPAAPPRRAGPLDQQPVMRSSVHDRARPVARPAPAQPLCGGR